MDQIYENIFSFLPVLTFYTFTLNAKTFLLICYISHQIKELNVRQIIILMITAVCFISCNDGSENKLSVADYFPLRIDNNWTYSDGYNEWTAEVSAYKNFDGIAYAEVVRTYQQSSDTIYYRAEGDDKVYVYHQGEEFLFIDFEISKDDSWETANGFTAKISSIGGTFSSPAGKFKDVVEVYSNNKQIADAFEIFKYAPGVGLIETTGFRKNSVLIKALVNNVNYPQ